MIQKTIGTTCKTLHPLQVGAAVGAGPATAWSNCLRKSLSSILSAVSRFGRWFALPGAYTRTTTEILRVAQNDAQRAGLDDALNGGLAVDDADVGGWGEGEVGGLGGDVFCDGCECEVGDGAVDFLDLHGLDDTGQGDDEGELTEALCHATGDAGDAEVGACTRGGDLVELFGEFGVPEEKAQRGAEVIELLSGGTRDLGVAGSVEPAVAAVEDEDFAGGIVVAPAHEAGFPEEEGACFGAIEAHAGVVLGVAGAEGAEVIVVVVDAMDEGRVGLRGGGGAKEHDQQGEGERDAGILHFVQNDRFRGRRPSYGRRWVQLAVPSGENRMTPSWSEQYPRLPVLPGLRGTAMSW